MTMRRLQWKPLIVAGLLSGLVQVVAGVIMYVSGVYFAAWSALVNLLLLTACVAGSIRWYVTRGSGGRATYLTALFAGVIMTVSTALVYAIYNIVSITFLYPGFLDSMARAFPGGERPTLGLVVANNLRGFCLWGTILSALAALALRTPDPNAS